MAAAAKKSDAQFAALAAQQAVMMSAMAKLTERKLWTDPNPEIRRIREAEANEKLREMALHVKELVRSQRKDPNPN